MRRLDRELRRVAVGGVVLDLVLGAALGPMHRGGYEKLGPARWKDYCREHLGMSEPAARALVARAQGLHGRPALLRALLEGRVGPCQVDDLLRSLPASGEQDELWAGQAETLSVHGLRAALARSRRSGVLEGQGAAGRARMSGALDGEGPLEGPGAAAGAKMSGVPEGQGPRPTTAESQGASDEADMSGLPGSDEAAPRPGAAGVMAWMAANLRPGAAPPLPDPEPEGSGRGGEWRSYLLPLHRYADFMTVEELCHRVAGEEQSRCRTFESLYAEFLAGAPPAEPAEPGEMLEEAAPVREPEMAEDLAVLDRCFGILEATPVEVRLSQEFLRNLPEHPHQRQEFIQQVLRCRQRLGFHLGRLLRRFRDQRGAQQLGFPNLEAYGESRLNLRASAMYQALRRDEKLQWMGIRETVLEGRISASQADLLFEVTHGDNAGAWAEYAAGHTVRRLAEVIRVFRFFISAAPEEWEARDGLPPQPGESLEDFLRLAEEGSRREAQRRRDRLEEFRRAGKVPPEVLDHFGYLLIEAERDAVDPQMHRRPRRGRNWSLARLPESVQTVSLDSLPEEVRTWVQPLLAARVLGVRTFSLRELPEETYSELQARTADLRAWSTADLRYLLRLSPRRRVRTFSPEDLEPRVEVRVWFPDDLLPVVREAEAAACRMAGRELTPEEVLGLAMDDFLETWGPAAMQQRARMRAFFASRGGRCEVPGCTCRSGLQRHHLRYRSHGGSDEDLNCALLCERHHLGHLHRGLMKATGRAPEAVEWQVGIVGGAPYQVYHGDCRVQGRGILAA